MKSFNSSSSSSPTVGDFVCVAIAGVGVVQLLTPADPIGSTLRLFRQLRSQEKSLTCASDVKKGIDEYTRLHSTETSTDERNKEYKSLVNSYYDLATLFYEWGWGQSFHFANRYPKESFQQSISRYENFIASKLGLVGDNQKSKVLDVGCGIGGPMRNICRFLGADLTGITLNHYQVNRCNEIIQTYPVHKAIATKCRAVQGDFMEMPFEPDQFDGAYAIEATCHAPDRVKCYSEVYRVLKPGSIFITIEWCMTDKYDSTNKEHLRIKQYIEEGDGLPDIAHTSTCVDAMKSAGFEVLCSEDVAEEDFGASAGGKAWMTPLLPSWNIFTQRFQFNWLGKRVVSYSLKVLEFFWLAPKGTSATQLMLLKGGIGLGEGGKNKIFTPMFMIVGRVPDIKEQ